MQKVVRGGLVVALNLAAFTMLQAQIAGKISGAVKDAATGAPLIGCNVTIEGTMLGAAVGVDGAYFILNVPPGKYDLHASMVGYERMTVRDVIVNSGRTTTLDFSLAVQAVEQKEVVVEATRPDVEREKTSTSAIIRSEDVQTVPGVRDIGDVIALAADVTDGHFRGGRTGEEYYTLQGMGIVNPLDNTTAFLPIMSAVEEVEVITSGFGAQYGNAQSGVVNISMKEGKSDRWSTRVETRSRAPGRKHFGPSVFDPNANPYLADLLNSAFWLRGDPSSDNPQPYYGSMGSGLINRYAGDTLVQLAVAQALWRQMRRDINRTYGNNMDYSIEAATGGPIDENLRMFLALRTDNEWPVFPTEQPDLNRQVMGNLAVDLGSTATFRISGGFSQENNNVFPGSNGVGGYQRWLWDRITGLDYEDVSNLQLGARFTKTLSPSTFYELKLNSVMTLRKVGSTPVPIALPDSMLVGPNAVNWTNNIFPLVGSGSPDGLDYQAGYDLFRDEKTRTISFDGNITSQVTNSHLLNAGAQFNTYLIDVSNALSVRTDNHIEDYRATPFEGALYVQDKMEFQGMIANLGLRWDLWSANTNYYTNPYSPFLVTDTAGRPYNDPVAAPQQKAPVMGRLQPRAGVSFPVSVNTVFHLNYGAFMQRPAFQYVVRTQTTALSGNPVILGNPRLEPEMTNSYDIGITQGLSEGFTLDVSGYYKDVKNLTEQATFTNTSTSEQVSSYFNLDYADIRGFRLALSKRRGELTGSINYHYSVATGKSATATNASPAFNLNTQTGVVTTDLSNVPIRDILLDFDRTHNVILTAAYNTPPEWGPQFLGGFPLGDMTLSATSFARSGRPYTSTENSKLINGARSPAEYNTNMRLTKRVNNFFGTGATFYVEVFNLFDDRILNYDYVFGRPTSSNPLTLYYYEHYGIDDPGHGIRYWWNKGKQGPFAVDQSFLIYDNAPRSFNFGFMIEL